MLLDLSIPWFSPVGNQMKVAVGNEAIATLSKRKGGFVSCSWGYSKFRNETDLYVK